MCIVYSLLKKAICSRGTHTSERDNIDLNIVITTHTPHSSFLEKALFCIHARILLHPKIDVYTKKAYVAYIRVATIKSDFLCACLSCASSAKVPKTKHEYYSYIHKRILNIYLYYVALRSYQKKVHHTKCAYTYIQKHTGHYFYKYFFHSIKRCNSYEFRANWIQNTNTLRPALNSTFSHKQHVKSLIYLAAAKKSSPLFIYLLIL